MLLLSNLKRKARRRSIEREIEWLDHRSKSLGEMYRLRMDALCNERREMRKRHLDRLEEYDTNIESLYACKISLLLKKNCIDEEYVVLQDRLLVQRSLYERSKEENELNAEKIFLANVEYFRRNHAAKIIQRNWKLYRARVPLRKRRSKRLTCG
ncbi:unnamed protein product [Heterotrigona itama]|uniref:Uncharacterized protein n=1 Tax=Heterotrigona itama TaxID=395501 RepID=A0A6V7H686_9HYME|nr:unnamed protein product [Heterotrigona itama]